MSDKKETTFFIVYMLFKFLCLLSSLFGYRVLPVALVAGIYPKHFTALAWVFGRGV